MQDFELIHMDVPGPMKSKSIGARSYALVIIDDITVSSTLLLLADRSQVYEARRKFMNRSEQSNGRKLQKIRLDGAGEH